jgi:chromosome partitioning protein
MSTVIGVLNPKGGSGKSTLATNLARALQIADRSVLIADLDPQGTALDWKNQEPEGAANPGVIRILDGKTLAQQLEQIAQAFDFVVLDGSAKVERLTGTAVRIADLVLIPVRPSPADLWGVADLVAAVHRSATPAAFVISQQVAGTLLAAEVEEALEEYELPVLNSRTAQRQAYAQAMAAGLSVLDFEPSGKAADEVRAIRDEILNALGKDR